MNSSQQIVLAQRPHGHVSLEDFRVEDVALPELKAGDVALETLFISIDPAIRAGSTTDRVIFRQSQSESQFALSDWPA